MIRPIVFSPWGGQDSSRLAMIQGIFAIALSELADSSKVSAYQLLAESLEQFHKAQQVISHDSYPQRWSIIEGQRAIALRRQGQLQSNTNQAISVLENSAESFRVALAGQSPSTSEWAEGHVEMATAFRELASRKPAREAGRLLEESIRACEIAMMTVTPERSPRVYRMATEAIAASRAQLKALSLSSVR